MTLKSLILTCLTTSTGLSLLAGYDPTTSFAEFGVNARRPEAGAVFVMGGYTMHEEKSIAETASKTWVRAHGSDQLACQCAANALWTTTNFNELGITYIGFYDFAGTTGFPQCHSDKLFLPCTIEDSPYGPGYKYTLVEELPLVVCRALPVIGSEKEVVMPSKEELRDIVRNQYKKERLLFPAIDSKLDSRNSSTCLYTVTFVQLATNMMLMCSIHEGTVSRATSRFYASIAPLLTPGDIAANFKWELKGFRVRFDEAQALKETACSAGIKRARRGSIGGSGPDVVRFRNDHDTTSRSSRRGKR